MCPVAAAPGLISFMAMRLGVPDGALTRPMTEPVLDCRDHGLIGHG